MAQAVDALGAGWDISSTYLYLALGLVALLLLCVRMRSSSGKGKSIKVDPITTSPTQFRPFKPIYHITMAVRQAATADLITIDQDYPSRIALRKQLITELGSNVHGVVDGGDEPTRELYSYLLAHVVELYPSIFSLKDGAVSNSVTGSSFPLSPGEGDVTPLLRALAETVEEDLFLLLKEGDTHRCVAFCCCFPSGFDPSQKLGLGLQGIHAPVPSYEKIGPSMERFFSRMEVGKPVSRVNWSVQTHDELHDCDRNHVKYDDVEKVRVDEVVDIDKTNLRCEFQTLTRLPKTQALLFSFKTYLYPVRQLKEEGLGPEFADAIEGLGKGNAPGMWKYKAAIRWGPAVCEYLRS